MSRNLDALYPPVERACRNLIAALAQKGIGATVTSTLRGAEEQKAIYAQGRRPVDEVNTLRAKAGLAAINERDNRVVTNAKVSLHQFGLAFDIALHDAGGTLHWRTGADVNGNGEADYEEAGRMGEALGLEWGGRFALKDMGHFQMTGGLSLDQIAGGLRPLNITEQEQKEKAMEKVKDGLRSTEFYLSLVGAVIPVINSYLGLMIPVEGMVSMASVIVSYVMSRTLVKRSA